MHNSYEMCNHVCWNFAHPAYILCCGLPEELISTAWGRSLRVVLIALRVYQLMASQATNSNLPVPNIWKSNFFVQIATWFCVNTYMISQTRSRKHQEKIPYIHVRMHLVLSSLWNISRYFRHLDFNEIQLRCVHKSAELLVTNIHAGTCLVINLCMCVSGWICWRWWCEPGCYIYSKWQCSYTICFHTAASVLINANWQVCNNNIVLYGVHTH